MNIRIYEDHNQLSLQAAQLLIDIIKEKPNAVLCLAAGETQLVMYQTLARLLPEKGVDFSKVHCIGLDEWVGILPTNPGSCQAILRNNLLDPLHIRENKIHFFDALATDLSAACYTMDALIKKLGGIDLICVGIGMNGHIGFNEPGVSPALRCHIATLDNTTRTVGQKYFHEKTPLTSGITLGLTYLLEAKTAVLMASKKAKAGIVKKALEEPIDPQVPASIIRKHTHGIVLLDQEAASDLSAS